MIRLFKNCLIFFINLLIDLLFMHKINLYSLDKIIKCWNNKIWWWSILNNHNLCQHQSLIRLNINHLELKILLHSFVWIRKKTMVNIHLLLFIYKTNHKFLILNLYHRSLKEIHLSWIYLMIYLQKGMHIQWYLIAKTNQTENKEEIKV